MRTPLLRAPSWLATWLLPSVAFAAATYQVGKPAPPRPQSAAPDADAAQAQDRLAMDIDAVAALDSQAGPSAPEPLAQPKPAALARTNGRALYEPARGAYLGVAVDEASAKGDPQVLAGLMRSWNASSGRGHALQLGFVQFPSPEGVFPSFDSDPRGWMAPKAFCEAADANGAAPILTLEPLQNPGQFARGWGEGTPAFAATESLAKSLGEWKKPVFVRWAHEMNGSWYPWAEWSDKNQNMKRDPGEETGFTAADYRASYRNVAALMRKHAPNVALVWCPNSGLLGGERRDVFAPFYPGDDVVDWVGLDVYERGWSGPNVGSKLWGGQFAHTLTHDAADDPATPANESVDFYKTYAQAKKKPMMIAETSATLSYRTDIEPSSRAVLNSDWKSAYWNSAEYGWLQAVYGTSTWQKARSQKLLQPIDTRFPLLKAVVWFQVAKQEWIPVERREGGRVSYQWFNDTHTDYRIGGGVSQDDAATSPRAAEEIELYRDLTSSPHFLSKIQP